MAKRNIKDEILRLKERAEFENGHYYFQRLQNLIVLADSFRTNKNREADEFFKYLPIASVASIESFTRASIKSLIDIGSPYFENSALLFNKTVQKLDFDILSNLQTKMFSIGELVSHLLPCNNIADLDTNFSTLLGVNLFDSLKKHKVVIAGNYEKETTIHFRSKLDSIKKSVARTFENRHIFCHESNNNFSVDRQQILSDFENCLLFLDVASDFIFSKLYKNWGLTAHQQVDDLANLLRQKEELLYQKIEQIKAERLLTTEDKRSFKKHFNATMKFWKSFVNEKATLKSSYSMSAVGSQYIFLEDKIKSIEYLFNDIY